MEQAIAAKLIALALERGRLDRRDLDAAADALGIADPLGPRAGEVVAELLRRGALAEGDVAALGRRGARRSPRPHDAGRVAVARPHAPARIDAPPSDEPATRMLSAPAAVGPVELLAAAGTVTSSASSSGAAAWARCTRRTTRGCGAWWPSSSSTRTTRRRSSASSRRRGSRPGSSTTASAGCTRSARPPGARTSPCSSSPARLSSPCGRSSRSRRRRDSWPRSPAPSTPPTGSA